MQFLGKKGLVALGKSTAMLVFMHASLLCPELVFLVGKYCATSQTSTMLRSADLRRNGKTKIQPLLTGLRLWLDLAADLCSDHFSGDDDFDPTVLLPTCRRAHPPIAWPLWPGCAILVGVLLLVPRKISITGLILADTMEVLTAALDISYSFRGLPSLNSLKALARYSFSAVIVAPVSAASVDFRRP